MPFLIFLDPEFWLGVIIAAWAMYGPAILLGVVVVAFVGLFIGYVIKTRRMIGG